MGSMNIKMRILPKSVETSLEKIKAKVKQVIEEAGGKGVNFEEEPVAFGLKAVITMFVCPENQELEALENKLKENDDINSLEVVDMRRAL